MDDEDDLTNSKAQFQSLPHGAKDFEHDWSYPMRRTMQEIVPGVFLGPYASATKKMLPALQENHVTHVVCVRHPLEAKTVKPNFPDLFQYLTIDLADNLPSCILPIFPRVKSFIDRCLESGGKVLIHGNTGISASATLAIAYIMETYGLNFNDALQVVQQRRFCVNPNESFKRQLMEYEAIYLARHQASHAQPSEGIKRSREDIDGEMTIDSPLKKFS